jgi:hypothetical protein
LSAAFSAPLSFFALAFEDGSGGAQLLRNLREGGDCVGFLAATATLRMRREE